MHLIFARLFVSGFLIYSITMYLLDLRFYWRNGWNFDEDHPGFEMTHGDPPLGKLSNRSRIIYGWPFFIGVSAFLTIGSFTVDHLG
jgi:hypothetical protein